MAQKSWNLDRRTFLTGCGVSLGLPFLDGMSAQAGADATAEARRFCAVYFPYGIVLRPQDSEDHEWSWFPHQTGSQYEFTRSLQPLEPLRSELTILGGLSHPNGRKMGGHDTADIWLTGAELKGGNLRNSISADQLIAQHIGQQTRYSSLVLSTDGGVGEPTRSSTLSFSRNGQPIPAENRPRLVFDRLFGVDPRSQKNQRRELENAGSMLDLVLEHSRSVRRRLGHSDQQKLDEYLASVRQTEQRVERSQRWLKVPKPNVPADGLHLEADDSTPAELIKTMYDLIFLAFQTDSTRVATYQLGNMNGATSIAGKFPQLLGYGNNMHALAHGARKGAKGAEQLGRWAEYLAEQFAYFLQRLQSTPDGDATLLDRTMVLYGSSNSHTHVNQNYPLILAGGRHNGVKHGQYLQLDERTPLSNLLVTILQRLNVPADRFVDSTGEVSEILS